MLSMSFIPQLKYSSLEAFINFHCVENVSDTFERLLQDVMKDVKCLLVC